MNVLEQADVAKDEDLRYDVFVSYRRDGVDGRVAVRLQRFLLSYRTPRSLVRAGKPARLGRVFRDSDELSAAPSLRRELDAALRQSRALIVVCSPRLVEKPDWVRLEVERFRELGHGQIYHLLIDGTPEEALPDWLRLDADPLAADIRRAGRVDLRRLRSEGLKLVAPLLGCELAELTRLEEIRDRRRLVGLISLTSSLALVFALLSGGLFISQRQLAQSNDDLKAEQAITDASLESHWQTVVPVWGMQEPERLAQMLFPEVKDEEIRLENLAAQLQTIINRDEAILERKPDDLNLREALRIFHAKKMAIAMRLRREKTAQEAFERTRELRLLNAADRLRKWMPSDAEPTTPWNDDLRLEPLRGLMAILRNGRDKTEPAYNTNGPVDYADHVSEYLPLLETWTPEGRAEARRVLNEASRFFEWKARAIPLSELDERIRDAVAVARSKLH